MAYETKPGEVTLFVNATKEKGDNKPDFKGNGINLDGERIDIAGWIARTKDGEIVKDKNGNKILNCKIQLEYKTDESSEEPPEDDLPF